MSNLTDVENIVNLAVGGLASSIGNGWMLSTAALVFCKIYFLYPGFYFCNSCHSPVMQAGFAMLEAGSCRSKNLTNILLKVYLIFPLCFIGSSFDNRQNLLDTCVGAIVWFLWGFAFAFGDRTNNPFIGNRHALSMYFFPSIKHKLTNISPDTLP